jgi:hypothetical protein
MGGCGLIFWVIATTYNPHRRLTLAAGDFGL